MTVRTRTLGLRVAALMAAGLVLTACNDDETATGAAGHTSPTAAASASPSGSAGGKAKEPAKPSSRPSGGAAGGDAAAQARTNKLALSAKEWDNAFVADGDDDTSLGNQVMDKSCKLKSDGTHVKGLVADTYRFVRQDHEKDSTFANTAASVFNSADAAAKDIAERRDNTKRCENYTDVDTHDAFQTVHDIESPQVAGADEVYSEEGLAVYDTTDGGRTDPRPFSYVIARKGAVTVSVFVDVDPERQVFEGRAQAREALKKLTAKW
ncbi:hypothetical protein ACFV1L_03130 [Kitasatospora sp. NPDC059646]|uniref:hypothetical protein n=1 Tax=Kitasatospora sp. NPDC059646 TaxID=3346893 RepID=UPI0036D04841